MNCTAEIASIMNLRSLRVFPFALVLTTVVLMTATLSAVTLSAPVLTPYVPETNGIVSGATSHQLAYTGTVTRFTATGLPRGVTLNPSTGLVSGRPLAAGNYSIIFTAYNDSAKSAPLTVYWTVEDLPTGTVGTYHALLDHQTWYNGGYGGSLRLTVAADGSYSGVITRGIHRNSIVGRLDTQPGGVDPEGAFSIPRRSPYLPLRVAFTLPIGTGQIFGLLHEPEGVGINLFGYRSAYSATRPATAYAGRWNTGYELPQQLVGNAAYPQGAAWATQTVSTSGLVTWTGRLADGTAFTHSTGLAEEGQTSLHVMLYNYNGSIQGWQTLNSLTDQSSAFLEWIKNPVGGRSYPYGFARHSLTGYGGLYTPPSNGSLVFGIYSGTGNARLIFREGGLASNYTQAFTLGAGHSITFPTGSGNPYKLSASVNITTGILTGSGTAMDFSEQNITNQRAGTLSALLIPGREQAVGHFQLPTTRSATAPILSGKLVGEENVQFN